MKKRIATFIAGLCAATVLVGCGKISDDNITIEKYKGIEVKKVSAVEVTDAHVEESIKSTLQAKSTQNEITDRAVQEGDIATIDYVGTKDGVAFDGGTAEDYPLTIGSGQFIDGFEEGIIGHNIGETFDLNLTFPENYQAKDLAGQDVVFQVTVKKIQEVIVPELTDELVTELSDTAKTIAEYKEEVKKDLKKSNEDSAKAQLQQSVWQALIEKCEVKKYPEGKKKELKDNINSQYGSMAQMYGLKDAETLVKQVYGISIDEMVENTIKQELAVQLIAKKENLKVSDKDYEKGLKKYSEQYGYADTATFESSIGKDNLKKVLLQEKVTDLLVENCKQIEAKKDK